MGNESIVHNNGTFTWATRGDDGYDTGEEIVAPRSTADEGDDLVIELRDRGFNVSKVNY